MSEPIEKRIRSFYCADNGEWLVERGKVKEAKLLKEACLEVESLRRQVNSYLVNDISKSRSMNTREQELERMIKDLDKREAAFRSKCENLMTALKGWSNTNEE